MNGIDKDEVRSCAAGQWPVVHLELCPGLTEQQLNGQHGPCPKCGGTDRFRVLNDYASTGGAYCNQCFNTNNFDGFAFLQWYNGWDFPTAVRKVAELINRPDALPPVQPPKKADSRPLLDQLEQLDATPDELRQAAESFAKGKPGVDVEAVLQSDPSLYLWHGERVLGFWGWRDQIVAAVLLYRIDGSPFPPVGNLTGRKSHLVKGSRSSWMVVGGLERLEAANFIWKTEGLPDAFALLPLLPQNHSVVTNSTGCNWRASSDRMPPLEDFRGKVVRVIGDADRPGQAGALAFASDVQSVAASVQLVRLPFPIAESHGADLRDYLTAETRKLEEVEGLLTDLPDDEASESKAESFAPGQLTNFWIQGSGKEARPVGLSAPDIIRPFLGMFNRVGGEMFIDLGVGSFRDRVYYVRDEASLFGLVSSLTGLVSMWRNGVGFLTKKEIYSELKRTVPNFDAVQTVPHEPKMPRCYYALDWPPVGDGSHLATLLGFFCPATTIDADLILAMFMTAIWGGDGGKRPVFAITADGPGCGKSALIAVLAELVGGLIELIRGEDFDRFKARLLSPEGRRKRLVAYDNIKSYGLSWPELEAQITAPMVSGRQNNVGESSRPNDLLWLFTGNGLSMSKDIAQRTVVIRLSRPEFSGDWDERVMSFVREHRQQILGDLIGALRKPPNPLTNYSRWGQWNSGVLSRLPEPDEAQAVIAERQGEVDRENDEVNELVDHFSKQLRRAGFGEDDMVFIPWDHCLPWCSSVFGKKNMTAVDAGRTLSNKQSSNSNLPLSIVKRFGQRGVLWNPDANPSETPKLFGGINTNDSDEFFAELD